jgi:hypothetical protein
MEVIQDFVKEETLDGHTIIKPVMTSPSRSEDERNSHKRKRSLVEDIITEKEMQVSISDHKIC